MILDFVFVYGPPAAGKYTVSKLLADETGYALFHNHLIVDAVAAVFPFGSESFTRLREQFWLAVFQSACAESRSFIFTFQPEPSVSSGFISRVQKIAEDAGSRLHFVHLQLSREQQEARIANESRRKFGKLRDVEFLKSLHAQFEACEQAIQTPHLVIDTDQHSPEQSATIMKEYLDTRKSSGL